MIKQPRSQGKQKQVTPVAVQMVVVYAVLVKLVPRKMMIVWACVGQNAVAGNVSVETAVLMNSAWHTTSAAEKHMASGAIYIQGAGV